MTGPKTVREPAKASPTTVGSVFLPLGNVQGAFDCWVPGISAFTEEVANFAQTRPKEDMSAWADLAKCKSAGEAFEFQSRFAQKTASEIISTSSTRCLASRENSAPSE
jgi:hypothetical protein